MLNLEISPQVRRLADRLMATPIGGTVTHGALNDAAGADVSQRRHWVRTALKVAQREAGAVFVCARGAGYRRLTTEELPTVGVACRKHIRLSARRAGKAIVAGLTVSNHVPETVKLRATAELGVLGLVEHLARDRSVARHEAEPSPAKVAEVAKGTMQHLENMQGKI